MQKLIACAAAITLAAVLVTTTTAGAAKPKAPPAKAVDSSKIVDAVTVNGTMRHLRALQAIANRNGGNRASGLPGFDATGQYVIDRLKSAGYRVEVQKFNFPFSQELAPPTLSLVAPEQRELTVGSFSYAGSGDATGPVVPVDVTIPPSPTPGSTSGCEASDFPPAPDDSAVALLQRGTCDFSVKAHNCADAGYAAAVLFNEGQPGRQEVLTGGLGDLVSIPVVGVSYADGAELAQTPGARVRVVSSTSYDPERESYNVIAELPAKKYKSVKPDEVVVVGSHIDSAQEGAGINDNGSGTAVTLQLAEKLAKVAPKKMQRPVRFGFWGAEEVNLRGSQYYVDHLPAEELADMYAYLNYDMIGSPNYVRFVYDGDGSDTGVAGPAGSGAVEKVFTDWFSSQNLASDPTAFDGRSDYDAFVDVGIPSGGLFSGAEGEKTAEQAAKYGGTAGENYDSCYHTACDNIGNVSTKALGEMGDAAAHAAWYLLDSRAGLFGDGSAPGRAGERAGSSPGLGSTENQRTTRRGAELTR